MMWEIAKGRENEEGRRKKGTRL